MKPYLASISFVALLAVSSAVALAAPPPPNSPGFQHSWHGHPGPPANNPGPWGNPPASYLKEDARYILQRTAQILMEAQQAAMRRHFRSGLGLAMAHQQKARELYWQGFYREAIFHSLRARNVALQISNGYRERWGWHNPWEPREDNYRRLAPADAVLDNRLDKFAIHGDDDAVFFHFDLDLNF